MDRHEVADLARQWGISPDYVDANGQHRQVETETLLRIIDSLSHGEGGRPSTPTGPTAAVGRAGAQRVYQSNIFRNGTRGWVIAVQLYAVRSGSNWGHGDFTDLAMLLDLAARLGATGVGVNPLHALFDDRPEQASPYSPNSRLFLNQLYIDLDAVPEFPGLDAAGLADEIARLRQTSEVAYAAVAAAKRTALGLAYDRFRRSASAERRADFEA